MLQDIITDFDAKCSAWARREASNARHADDDSEHVGKLRALLTVMIAYWNAVFDDAPSIESIEANNPGR